MSKTFSRNFVFMWLLSVSLCACSSQHGREQPALSEKTNQQVITEFKPKLVAFGEACQDISKLISKSSAAAEPVPIKGLEPVPCVTSSTNLDEPIESNTDVIMSEQLANPAKYFSGAPFEKLFTEELPFNVGKGGQIYSYFYAFDQCTDKGFVVSDDSDFKHDMIPAKKALPKEKALKLCVQVLQHGPPKYLGIIRVNKFSEPKLIDSPDPDTKLGYLPGMVDYDFFFVDVPTKRILGSFKGKASNDESVEVEVQKSNYEDQDKRDALSSKLSLQLKEKARWDIYAKLGKLTGVEYGD